MTTRTLMDILPVSFWASSSLCTGLFFGGAGVGLLAGVFALVKAVTGGLGDCSDSNGYNFEAEYLDVGGLGSSSSETS